MGLSATLKLLGLGSCKESATLQDLGMCFKKVLYVRICSVTMPTQPNTTLRLFWMWINFPPR